MCAMMQKLRIFFNGMDIRAAKVTKKKDRGNVGVNFFRMNKNIHLCIAMKILFVGGCLLTSNLVEKEKRFINVLLLKNPQLKVSMARYVSFSLVDEIISSRLAEDTPDIIVFLVRTFPFRSEERRVG